VKFYIVVSQDIVYKINLDAHCFCFDWYSSYRIYSSFVIIVIGINRVVLKLNAGACGNVTA